MSAVQTLNPNAHRSPAEARFVDACPTTADWLAAMLDEIDYGMLLVAEDGTVMHANQTAMKTLAAGYPIASERIDGRLVLCNRDGLLDTIAAAVKRRIRKLVFFDCAARAAAAAVVPIGNPWPDAGGGAALVMLGKRSLCDALTVQCYAIAHRLTGAETTVLSALCEGERPLSIAARKGVAASTLRTQVSTIREKTRTNGIDALLFSLAVLPPILPSTGRIRSATTQFGA
jgi:DNA-binding CsgD family transcriptional regulator